MKRLFRRCRAAFLMAVVLALVTWLIAVARTAMQLSVRLPDGSVLRVAKVEYGGEHDFYRGSEALSKAGELVSDNLPFYYDLPSGIRNPFERLTSYTGESFSTGGDSLTVWFWHQPGASQAVKLKGAELLDDAIGEPIDFSEIHNAVQTIPGGANLQGSHRRSWKGILRRVHSSTAPVASAVGAPCL